MLATRAEKSIPRNAKYIQTPLISTPKTIFFFIQGFLLCVFRVAGFAVAYQANALERWFFYVTPAVLFFNSRIAVILIKVLH